MSEWKAKRFWTDTTVEQAGGGWQVLLDGRQVRTPLKSAMILPTPGMAQAVADEWATQEGVINPLLMPMTRSANAAIDKVAPQHAEVAAMLAAYAETDLLCHRADSPAGLVDQQNKGWNPVLDWARSSLGAPLNAVVGILPTDQPQHSLDRYARIVAGYRPFSLTGLHDLVALSGSLVLALHVADGQMDPDFAFRLSRIDEDWQIAQWGEDEEATEAADIKRAAFLHAASFLRLSQGS